jgi:hypothetical protein
MESHVDVVVERARGVLAERFGVDSARGMTAAERRAP